jgi:type II secretory pathway component PulF
MPLYEVVRQRAGVIDKALLFAPSIEVVKHVASRANYNLIQAHVHTIPQFYLYWHRTKIMRCWQSVVSLIQGGLHITEALQVIASYETSLVGMWFMVLADGLERGHSLGELLDEINVLNQLEKDSLVAAYKHGEFLKSLQKISLYQSERAELINSFKRLAAIPIFGILSIFIFIGFFIHVILPTLYNNIKNMNFYFSHDQERFLLFIEYLIHHSFSIVMFFIGLLFLIFAFIVITLRYARFFQYLIKIPIVNRLVVGKDLYTVASFLSLALAAGLPINQSLSLVIQQTRLSRIKHELSFMHDMVLAGYKLDEIFAKTLFARYFPEALIMLRVGFESGNVASAFERIEYYVKNQVLLLIRRFQLVIQPLLLVLAALIIVLFIKNLYFPMLMLPLEATSSMSF